MAASARAQLLEPGHPVARRRLRIIGAGRRRHHDHVGVRAAGRHDQAPVADFRPALKLAAAV